MKKIVGKHGGYRKLDSFTLTSIIQLATWRFCNVFLNRRNDPCGRQFDQMTQAARSGRQNIVEGSERAGTSAGTEMRLTDVARASLAELKADYEFWLLSHKIAPWEPTTQEAQGVFGVRLDPNPLSETVSLHQSAVYTMAQYEKFAPWLDSDDPTCVANAMLILISRVLNMLNRQLEVQSEVFQKEGGFHERMSAVRREERDKEQADPNAPACPDCGKAMCQRTARSGRNAGQLFWGCSAFPECKGIREI
ncbi:MAG: four helix bundle suffix domain-containing protein [Kiritimatiellae bacterium]|nr:four helix bundle suffix domain-containing protein [Kiritimatiellia bacterium]